MSINVTVRGNPISIKRGRMVTHDIENEFERRRRIRLQQVRQQSKEIAADIRNRVRKEKESQLSKVEQRTEEELKRWKARKLAKLEKQLSESDRLRGDAQERAKNEPDPETILKQINEKNHQEAIERAKIAHEEKRNLEKQIQRENQKRIELRKTTRSVENARSALVSKIHQENKKKPESCKKKKPKRHISHSDSDKDKPNRSPSPSPKVKHKKTQKIDIDFSSPEPGHYSDRSRSRSSGSTSPSPQKPYSSNKNTSTDRKKYSFQAKKSKGNDGTCKKKIAPRTPSPTILDFSSSSERSIMSYRYRNSSSSSNDSRDASKQRSKEQPKNKPEDSFTMPSNLESLITVCKGTCADKSTNTKRNPTKKKKPTKKDKPKKENKFEITSHDVVEIPAELPFVPTTCIDQEPRIIPCPAQAKRVSCIDLDNKFVSTYETEPLVTKISKLNLIRDEDDTEQKDIKSMQKTMTSRDAKAHQRGVQALQKHKIQKDYQQLMEELPVLQRQERLAQMKTHDPTLHMPEDRIKQLEKRRQNKIETIFEKYYNKAKILETPTITIRPVQKPAPTDDMKLPFRALDVTESPIDLNVGSWERPPCFKSVGSPPCAQLKQTVQVCHEVKCRQQQEVLMDLLRRVNRQRELLMQEVASLPNTTKKLLVSEGTSPPMTNKTPRKLKKTKTVATSPQKPTESRSSSKSKLSVASNSSAEFKKKSKKKAKRKEEETQTSPSIKKLDVDMMFVTDKNKAKESEPIRCQHCPPLLICSCPPELRSGKKEDCICANQDEPEVLQEQPSLNKSDKVCEIVIKTKENAHVRVRKDDNSPQVILNVTKKDAKVKSHSSSKSSASTTFVPLPKYSQREKVMSTEPSTYKHLLYNKPQQTNVEKEIQPLQTQEKKICPNLLKYIKKLLSMSRRSIDELTVSSISEVSTPGNSIINTSPNVTPLMQLQNIMQKYNISMSDIQRHLSPSSSEESIKQKPKMASEMIVSTSTESDQPRSKSPRRSKTPPSRRKSSPKRSSKSTSPKRSAKASKSHEVSEMVESLGLSHDDVQEIPNILSRYKDLTQTCCDRICKLTKLIDNVRLEKERILSPASDKYETSVTSYFDLPPFSDSTRSGGNKSSETSSMSQDEVDRYLLSVHRPGSPSKVKSPKPKRSKTPPKSPPSKSLPIPTKITSSPKNKSPPRHSKEQRQPSIPDPPAITITAPEPQKTCTPDTCENRPPSIELDDEVPVSDNLNDSKNQPFVPMLQGIPKFHETDHTTIYIKSPTKYAVCPKSRPPPSFRNNRLDLHITPHELSTINELDTMISSRSISEIIIRTPSAERQNIRSSVDEPFMQIKLQDDIRASAQSPKGNKHSKAGSPSKEERPRSASPVDVRLSKSDSNPSSPKEKRRPSKTKPQSPKRHRSRTPSPTKEKPEKEKQLLKSSSSSPDSSSPMVSGVLALTDKSSSSSADDMAAILQKMGMGWAVATLKKTHDQYILSTSSSSTETSFKKLSKDSSNFTDVSLKNILSIGVEKKFTTMLFSESPEFELQARPDMEICGCDYTVIGTKDASTQRTSTPVQHSKSADSKKDLFSGDSDISSVRMNGDEFLFLSIPNVSLNTNKTLNRSDD